MSKLDNKLWQVWTALKLFYLGAGIGNFVIGMGALLVTTVFVVQDAPLLMKAFAVVAFAFYNIRNYFIAKNFICTAIVGALHRGVSKTEVENLLETPWEYYQELQSLHDTGRRIQNS